MLRRAAAAAVVLAGSLAPVAYADGGPGGGVCDNSGLLVTVCASDDATAPGSGGDSGTAAKPAGASGGGDSKAPKCAYLKVDPPPPPTNLAWEGKTPKDGAVYRVMCPDTGRVGVIFVPNGGGPAAPTIDPETVARQAVDSMKLTGPAVASPKAGGKYVVGMPMWMWVEPSATTYGPATATATAGGVTVTATAEVSFIAWKMGDGSTATCSGPGTRYDASKGKTPSPDCGHLYKAPSTAQKGGRYAGTATATWTVEWQAAALGDAGEFTEVRQTPFAVDVQEVQVLN
ncbi:ATP/GTP-binding protein [Streptomyces sp. NPDC048479]|uniref:ATP/GTP-binding protein n=1 Tax=Streptomyces sp. NPDC048479 TaxID=3154725 RepID=UPI00341F08EC